MLAVNARTAATHGTTDATRHWICGPTTSISGRGDGRVVRLRPLPCSVSGSGMRKSSNCLVRVCSLSCKLVVY